MIVRQPPRSLHSLFALAASSPSSHCQNATRHFTTTLLARSKIGRMPISIPSTVTMTIVPPEVPKKLRIGSRTQPMSTVHIKGPRGEISLPLPPFIQIDQTITSAPVLDIEDKKDRLQKAMWGTTRAYLANHVLGVSEGHTAILRLVGVGYRATVESKATTVQAEFPGQQFINLKVGYSHPIELPIPAGVTASTPAPTRILLEGVDKEVVMSFAAKIRMWRKPEPYKGKGIFVNGETIRLKNKKIK